MSSGPPATPSFLPLRSVRSLDRGIGGNHDGAKGRGEGREGEIGAATPLARYPQPVGGDDIDRAALQTYRGRLGACERHDVEVDSLRLVEAIALNGVNHPTDRPEFEDTDCDLIRRLGRRVDSERRNGGHHEG